MLNLLSLSLTTINCVTLIDSSLFVVACLLSLLDVHDVTGKVQMEIEKLQLKWTLPVKVQPRKSQEIELKNETCSLACQATTL